MEPYIISTERLGLRRWLTTDVEPFVKMNKDEAVMKYFPKTLTEDETLKMVERINGHFDKNNFGLFAVENKLTGEFIGFTGFAIPTFESFFTPCVEIGWRYKKEAWGQGFATEAAMACLDYGFNVAKLDKILSFTASVNITSEKVMRKIGMTCIGSFYHPKIDSYSILCQHILYEITNNKV